MPLLRGNAFSLAKTPEDLLPDELVYQVRFTKEIFRDYEEYLKRMNLYRQRIWTCKVTGKANLTYETALVSECKAPQKTEFPREFMGPVLQMVQFSELELDELVEDILKAFRNRFVVGEEVSSVQGDAVYRCKILRLCHRNGAHNFENLLYEVGWLDRDGKIAEKTFESGKKLMRKKLPFTRALLKTYIQESTYEESNGDTPWLVRDTLAQKFDIPLKLPSEHRIRQEPRQRILPETRHDSETGAYRKGKRTQRQRRINSSPIGRLKNESHSSKEPHSGKKSRRICYPIEDTLLEIPLDDPSFTQRPIPSTAFLLPMECIGILLMVWDFCMLFGKFLQLSPFSIEDFESSLMYKEGEPSLLREAHFALLRAVMADAVQRQKVSDRRRQKMTIDTWKQDLCDVFDLEGVKKSKTYSALIRGGQYLEIEPLTKLEILQELIELALDTMAIRGQLTGNTEEAQPVAVRKYETVTKQAKKQKLHSSYVKISQETPNDVMMLELNEIKDEHTNYQSLKVLEKKHVCETSEDVIGDEPIAWSAKGKRKPISSPPGNGMPHRQNDKEDGLKDSLKLLGKSEQPAVDVKTKAGPLKKGKNLNNKRLGGAKSVSEVKKRKLNDVQEQEKHRVRTTPLGRDRDLNRYWFFQREGRIFVESEDCSKWAFYSGKMELDALCKSLNVKGMRERALQRQLDKHYAKISAALQKRTKEIAQRVAMEEATLRRSLRVRSGRSTPRPSGFLAYVNKYRN